MIIPGLGDSDRVGVESGVEQEMGMGAADAAGEAGESGPAGTPDGDSGAGDGDRRLEPRLSIPVYNLISHHKIIKQWLSSPDSSKLELVVSTHCSLWSGVTLESDRSINKLSSNLFSIFH